MSIGTTNSVNRKQRLFSVLATAIGIVLFWRGIWELSQKLFSTEISLIIGTLILVLAAVVDRREISKYIGSFR